MITELDTSGLANVQGLTPEHRARRRQFVTASDFPILCGLVDGKGPRDVYLDKLGMLEEADTSDPAAIGTGLEPSVLDLAEKALGLSIIDRGAWYTNGRFGATLDGRVDDQFATVNAKTSGMVDSWADGPPPYVRIQVQAEMMVTGAIAAIIPVLLGGFGPLKFRAYRVDRDPEMEADLKTIGAAFLNYLDAREMPPGEPASLESLRRVMRVPNKVVLVDDAPVTEWKLLRQFRLNLEKQVQQAAKDENRALRRIIEAMGDAEGAQCSTGVLTWMEQARAGYTAPPTAYRVARFKEIQS